MQYLCGSRSYYHRRNFLETAVVPPQIFCFFCVLFFLIKCFPNSKQRLHTIICMKINIYDEKKKNLQKLVKELYFQSEKNKNLKICVFKFQKLSHFQKITPMEILEKKQPNIFYSFACRGKKTKWGDCQPKHGSSFGKQMAVLKKMKKIVIQQRSIIKSQNGTSNTLPTLSGKNLFLCICVVCVWGGRISCFALKYTVSIVSKSNPSKIRVTEGGKTNPWNTVQKHFSEILLSKMAFPPLKRKS